jgi:hypothetical protein
MVDKEDTYLFHWTQSFDNHTKQLIRLELQNEHKVFWHKYKNATSLGDVDNHYVLISCWWLSFGAASEATVHELGNHFSYWIIGAPYALVLSQCLNHYVGGIM